MLVLFLVLVLEAPAGDWRFTPWSPQHPPGGRRIADQQKPGLGAYGKQTVEYEDENDDENDPGKSFNPQSAIRNPRFRVMHELSLAATLVEMVEREAKKAGMSQVARVKIRVGPLSGVSVDSLTFCFGALVDQSWCKGAGLDVETPPGVMKCRTCATSSDFTKMSYVCPSCGSVDVEVQGSRELELREISGE